MRIHQKCPHATILVAAIVNLASTQDPGETTSVWWLRGVRVGVRGEGRDSPHRAWQQPALSSQWRQRMHLGGKGRTGQRQLS